MTEPCALCGRYHAYSAPCPQTPTSASEGSMSEPTRVVIADHDTDELRTDLRTVLIQDRGRTRELRLRVARGVIKDIKPRSRHKRDCPRSVSYEVGSGAPYECTCGIEPRDGRDVL